ncbi:MAG TPA: alpha/beta hydrolase [Blastocatellia bacterium]|nr:alpha/beta hydrolase [Blastocatellia bacterium]
MHRTKLTTIFLFLCLSLPAFAQSTKSGSIFTDATTPRAQLPTLEEIKTDPPNATVIREITYCKVGGRDLRMDAYLPKNRGTSLSPPLIYIHGGAWITGDKDEGPIEQDLNNLLDRGFAVFSINYRLGPLNQFPAQIEDCKCAVRSLRANGARYNIDAKRIGVWGSSAGGHLAALLGTTGGISQLEGYGGYPEQSSVVQAVATYFGPADLTTSDWGFIDKIGFLTVFGTSRNWAKVSPINYVTKGDAPFYVIGGDRDDRVDERQQQIMYAKLQAVGVPSELLIVKNCGHEFAPKGGALNPSRAEVTKRLGTFFDKYLRTTTLAASAEPSGTSTRREVAPR